MRYYRIEIDGGSTVFTSYANGKNIRGALQVEMDIPVAAMHSPDNAGAFVEIWGVPLSQISQAKNLNYKGIKVYGGFQKGLPLANPKQSGLLVQGYISQSFGNWQGTDMSLDLIIAAGPPPEADAPPDKAKNISFNWKKGQTVDAAVKSALSTAYPGYTVTTNSTATWSRRRISPASTPASRRSPNICLVRADR